MNKPTLRITGAILLLLGSALLIGCPPNQAHDIVTINYEQHGACNGLVSGYAATSAGPKQAYVVFKISTIDNRDSAARDFDFDPNKVYVTPSSPREYANNTSGVMPMLNPFLAQARTVVKGTSSAVNGDLLIVVSTTADDGASEASNISYMLLYDSPAGSQGVSMVKTNVTQTSWAYTPDCTTITY